MSDLRTTIHFTEANWKRMVALGVRARRIHKHGFTVPSTRRENVAYFISVRLTSDGLLDPRCNCEAGKANTGCCHALSVVAEFNHDLSLRDAIAPKDSFRVTPRTGRTASLGRAAA